MVKESGLDVSEWFRTVMDMCRFANPKEFTHTNTYQFAKNLYEVLFRPETSGNVYDRIGERMRKQFPDGRIFSDHPSGFSVMSAPAEEEFIQEIRMAVTKDADYASCMYDGAPEVLRFLLERGTKTVIFTNGDHVGIPDLDLPGTRQQLYKVAHMKIPNTERRRVAQERNLEHGDVLSIVASENKMEMLPGILKDFYKRGISVVVYVDDRLGNLVEAGHIFDWETFAMRYYPVWLRQGSHTDKIPSGLGPSEELSSRYHIVEDLRSLPGVFDENEKRESIGIIVDLDGVLLDDRKTERVVDAAIEKRLTKKGWIRIESRE